MLSLLIRRKYYYSITNFSIHACMRTSGEVMWFIRSRDGPKWVPLDNLTLTQHAWIYIVDDGDGIAMGLSGSLGPPFKTLTKHQGRGDCIIEQ